MIDVLIVTEVRKAEGGTVFVIREYEKLQYGYWNCYISVDCEL
jgi:hypothetical protein